jgi:hypothetical protein
MERYLYFADGNGANLTGEAATLKASNFMCAVPRTHSTTVLWFKRDDCGRDYVVLTHDNTASTTDGTATGHRVKDVAKAIASAVNAGPHTNGIVDFLDFDNNIKFPGLSSVTACSINLASGGNIVS